MPDEPEALGLLALMLLHDARRATRVDDAGDLVPLEDQDRTRWDRAGIEEGVAALDAALRRREPGPYQVQAAIAACHATATDAADTDWTEIALLYEELGRMAPSPVVELNRAVAVAMADGPAVGLALVDGWRRRAPWPATTCCRPPGPTCCAASTGPSRRPPPTAGRSTSPAPTPSGATSPAAWPRSGRPADQPGTSAPSPSRVHNRGRS